MQNILRYLTPEILAWESGNIQEVRPLGSVLCLPDGREWYAFGFTRDAYYGSLSLLMASSRRECGEWARANSPAAIRFGAQRYLIDIGCSAATTISCSGCRCCCGTVRPCRTG
jgi:hypothetical protein